VEGQELKNLSFYVHLIKWNRPKLRLAEEKLPVLTPLIKASIIGTHMGFIKKPIHLKQTAIS